MQFKKFIAELLGTMLLVVFGCGTAIITQCSFMNIGGYISTALAFGITLMMLLVTFGKVSGGHFNPAVSVAMLLNKELSFKEFVLYVIAQFAGAFLGAYIIRYIVTSPDEMLFAVNTLYDNSYPKTILVEGIMTAAFVLTVLFNYKNDSKMAPVYIGGSLTAMHLFGLGLTGTSVNPARTIGIAVMYGSDAFNGLLAFVAGPILGAIVAWILYICLMDESVEPNNEPHENSEKPKKKKKHLRLKVFSKKKKKEKIKKLKERVETAEGNNNKAESPKLDDTEPSPDDEDELGDGIDFDFDDNF